MAYPALDKRPRWSSFAWFLLLAFAAPSAILDDARAGNMQPTDSRDIGPDRSPGPLDGRSFSGKYGPLGKPADGHDTWVFQNGSFWSKGCLECGFPQSVYSTRAESGTLDFKTTTSCPVSDADIVWEGTVDDGKIEGVFTWTKKRWYRTVRKRFWFKGTLEEAPAEAEDNGS